MYTDPTEKVVGTESLRSREMEILRRIYASFAGQSFDDASFMKLRMEGYSGVEHLLSFLVLRKKGYIRAVMNTWGERLYYIAIERLAMLHRILYTYQLIEVKEEVILRKEAKPGLALDVFHVLVFIANEPLPLTTKGAVHKKTIQKITDRLNLKGEDLKGLTLQVSNIENVPVHINLILDLLHELQLVTKEPRQIVLREKALYTWLNRNTEQMTSILLKIVIERFGSKDTTMQHLWCSICQSPIVSGQWVEMELLLEWMLQQQLLEPSQLTEMRIQANTWLYAFAGLGWMEVGILADHRICFRWSISADEVRNAYVFDKGSSTLLSDINISKFYVQPDFDIIVLPNVSNLLRWKLMMFTELHKSDRTSIYRLTKASILQALRKGVGVNEMISFMMEHAETGVPDHISLTIRQWAKETNEGELLNTEFIENICREQYEYETGDYEIRSFYKDDYNRHRLHVEDDLPLRETLFQGIDQIPKMWMKDFRSYHFSTGIQMMEQAILWKTSMKLSLEGKEVDFIPLHITYNPFEISGEIYNAQQEKYEQIQLSPSDWKEMRLIVPNFT